jgi:glycosyltransferase involved in cell wall biosynthesis
VGEAETAGGAERQISMIAKGLRSEGISVSFLCDGDTSRKVIENGFIFHMRKLTTEAIFPINAFVLLFNLFSGIYKSNTTCYYVRGRPGFAVLSMICCSVLRKKSIYAVANNSNIDYKWLSDNYNILFPRFFLFILNHVPTKVIVQTNNQQNTLQSKYGIETEKIANGFDVPNENEIRSASEGNSVLWIGRISRQQKKPERFLKLADSLPGIPFVMVGPSAGDESYYEHVKQKADRIENLEFVGFVPPSSIDEYYQDAAILINTSDYEGFPNTFLEAWGHATPVLSLHFDLDGILKKQEVGMYTGSMEKLIESVELLYQDPDRRAEYGNNARSLVKQEFSIDRVVSEYVCLISEVFKEAD